MTREDEIKNIALCYAHDELKDTWGNPIAFNVTHWMPLPQTPKGGE